MPLPRLDLEDYTEKHWGGSGYEDLPSLLQAVHEGVLELGVGVGSVLHADNYTWEPPSVGFVLYDDRDPERWRRWGFFITVPKWKATREGLSPGLLAAFNGGRGRGRVRLSIMLQEGLTLSEIEHILNLRVRQV